MITAVNKENKDKTKLVDELIFRNVSLVCFTAELDELVNRGKNRSTCKLNSLKLGLQTCMCTKNYVCVFMLSRLFCSS